MFGLIVQVQQARQLLWDFWATDPFWAGHWGKYGLPNTCKYVGTNYDSCNHPHYTIANHPWQIGDKGYPKIGRT
jgi:hypothetical protein